MKYLLILLLMVGCGSDKDAYTNDQEHVDDMPRRGNLVCGRAPRFMVCSNETIEFRVDYRNNTAKYKIRVD